MIIRRAELWFSGMKLHLMELYISEKFCHNISNGFCHNISNGFGVIERTRFVTDGWRQEVKQYVSQPIQEGKRRNRSLQAIAPFP